MPPFHSSRDDGHLLYRVAVADVMTAQELRHVAVQVLRAHAVKRPVVATLEQRPERLDSVDVSLSAYILAYAMRHGLVIREPLVCTVLVAVHVRFLRDARADESLEGHAVGALYDGGAHTSCSTVLDARDGSLADSASACPELLVRVLVAFLATNERLIYLDRANHRGHVGRSSKRFTNALLHEPGAFLCNAKVVVELIAGHALERGHVEVDRVGPLTERDRGTLHHRTGLHAEVLAAVAAAVRHLRVLTGVGAYAPAGRAGVITRRPQDGLEPLTRRLVIGKHLCQLHEGDCLAMSLALCLSSHFRVPFLSSIRTCFTPISVL